MIFASKQYIYSKQYILTYKMFLQLSVLLLAFNMINCQVSNEYLDSIYGIPEPECNQQGGLCILNTECDNVLQVGLCPTQQNFECCNAVPRSEIRCRKLGGECMEKGYCTNKKVFISRAQDCTSNEECCLV